MLDLDIEGVAKVVGEIKKGFEEFKSANDENIKSLVKGAVDPLLEEKLAKIGADMDKKQEQIDKLFASTRRKSVSLNGQEVSVEDLDKKALAWAQMNAKARGTSIQEYTHEQAQEYKGAFVSYLRKDDRVLSSDELKALSVGVDADGGYLTAPDTSGRIVQKQFETSPMRQFASVMAISTDSLEGLYDLDEASCGWVSERGSRSETSTPQLDAWRIPVHEMYAMPKATQKILDDAMVDVESWLAAKVADKFTRTENASFLNGTGVGQPRGLLTYGSGTTLPGTIERFATGVNGGFAAAPSGADKLIDVVQGLKSNYLGNAIWFANRLTIGGLRKMKNSDGAYLWQPSITVGAPATLLGYPIVGFEDMPNYTTTDALALGFGDLSQAYQIVDRLGIRVLRDPYSAKPYVLFYTTKRVGGDVINFEAVKLVKFATA